MGQAGESHASDTWKIFVKNKIYSAKMRFNRESVMGCFHQPRSLFKDNEHNKMKRKIEH